MVETDDSRIAKLLLADTLPVRDAAFRINVLQRRERKRFQRKTFLLFAAAIALAMVLTLGANAGADIVGIVAIAVLCVLSGISCVISARGVQELLHRIRVTGKR